MKRYQIIKNKIQRHAGENDTIAYLQLRCHLGKFMHDAGSQLEQKYPRIGQHRPGGEGGDRRCCGAATTCTSSGLADRQGIGKGSGQGRCWRRCSGTSGVTASLGPRGSVQQCRRRRRRPVFRRHTSCLGLGQPFRYGRSRSRWGGYGLGGMRRRLGRGRVRKEGVSREAARRQRWGQAARGRRTGRLVSAVPVFHGSHHTIGARGVGRGGRYRIHKDR